MKHSNGRLLAGILAIVALGGTLSACGSDDGSAGSGRAAESAAAKPSAVDRAFVRQMIPHHQMAVDMAKVAEQRGEHADLKRLATDIIAAQNKEISELRAIAKDLGVTPDAPMTDGGMETHGSMGKDAKTLGLAMNEMGMSMRMTSLQDADPFDRAFIEEMTPHHEGAIAMAKAELAGGENAGLKKIATAIIAAQEKEIAEMASWKAAWYPGDASGSSEQSKMDDMGDMGEHSGH